jgi:hypothetical protein
MKESIKEQILAMKDEDIFFITYYAKKYEEIITRKATWTKPNTDTQGKYFVSKDGNDIFVYWDLNAEPNKNGNKWRHATNPIRVEMANV